MKIEGLKLCNNGGDYSALLNKIEEVSPEKAKAINFKLTGQKEDNEQEFVEESEPEKSEEPVLEDGEFIDEQKVLNSGVHKTEDLDSSKWHVPDIPQFEGADYNTQIQAIVDMDNYLKSADENKVKNEDGTYTAPDVPWETANGTVEALDEGTKKILNNKMFKGMKVKSVSDSYNMVSIENGYAPSGHMIRNITMEDGSIIKITAYADSYSVKITKVPKGVDPTNPKEGDTISQYKYVELGDGYYVMMPEAPIYADEKFGSDFYSENNPYGKIGFGQNAVELASGTYEFYDSDGNIVKWGDPKREELLNELKQKFPGIV